MSVPAPPWWPSRQAFLEAPLAEEGLARLAADVVPGGSVRSCGPLEGGMESAVHAIDLVDRQGRAVPAVLKRRQDLRIDGRGEWAALAAAWRAEVPTPEPLAFDPEGRWFGGPALVMSRLPGRSRLGASVDDATLGALARGLVAIHDRDAPTLDESRPRWRRGAPNDPSPFERSVWGRILELSGDAGQASALVHLDFHPGNALWLGDALSGLIDWENGARGWPGEDMAKCCWYLHCLHGPAAADRFREAYEAEFGGPVDLLVLCEASYAVGVLRQADHRAFFLRRSGFRVTAEFVRAMTRSFIERAIGPVV